MQEDGGLGMVDRARVFATQAHQRIDHRRKYSQQPYEAHLKAVAELVGTVSDDPEMLAAAWLHDVVEDTPATLEDVEREFGPAVAQLVKQLTDVSRPGDGNRAARKAMDLAHLAAASARAQTIKLADLCDNAVDITAADTKFAPVYLREMAALLDVLRGGDARLMAKARRVLAKCQARLGPATADMTAKSPLLPAAQAQLRALSRQMHTFSVRDLARPLPSLDAGQPVALAASILAVRGGSVLGLRRDGQVCGYARAEDLGPGGDAVPMRRIEASQVLDNAAPLSALVHVLTRHEYAFVRVLGEVGGVLARDDLQQPIGRMWLFGMVTFMELEFRKRIARHWLADSWQGLLTAGRLEKARQLQAERRRQGQPAELLDCLQFSDLAGILVEDAELLQAWGYRSKRSAQASLRDLESLRNHLAHSQEVVARHWPQIVRMTGRFEEALLAEDVPEGVAAAARSPRP